jgi:hypothetical protein
MMALLFSLLQPEKIDLVILMILVFLALWEVSKAVLRWMSARTKSPLDDKLLALMERAESGAKKISESEWIRDNAPRIFAAIENLSKISAPELRGAKKLATALTVAHMAYDQAAGQTLSNDGVRLLEAELARKAAETKKN